MLLFTALHAMAGVALAAPPQEAFQDWLRGAVEAEELQIVRWGPVDRDQDGHVDYLMATLCDAGPESSSPSSPWRVYEAAGQRWVVEHGRSRWRCDPASPPAFEALEPPMVDRPCGGNYYCGVFIEPMDGHIVVTRTENRDLTGFTHTHNETDWLHGTTRRRWTEYTAAAEGGMIGRDHVGAIIVVGRDLTEQPTFNRVLSGADAWGGPDDASLSVVAVQPSLDHVQVVVRVTDDAHTSGDRLEVWWVCHSCAPPSRPGTGARDEFHHLGFTWSSADDGGQVTILRPNDAPDVQVPVATRSADGAITLRFAHGQFTRQDPRHLRGPAGWSLPFTVIFDDSDSPNGTPTRVATSDLDPEEPRTYGTLVRHRDQRRFHVPSDDFVVRRLAPGETRLRGPR